MEREWTLQFPDKRAWGSFQSPDARWHQGTHQESCMGQAFLHRQLLLVLLPIVALAVFGGMSLRRDRFAVEREARERALEATSRLADRFAEDWPRAFQKAKARWVAGGSNAAFAELRFDPGLRLVRPVERPDAPVPPAWRRILSEPVLAALDGLRQAEAVGNADRVREFGALLQGATGSPPVIHAVAELSRLRVATGAGEGGQSGLLLKLAQGALAEQWVNEAGLPLAMSAALFLAGQDPVAMRSPEGLSVVEGLVREQPSMLIGRLLERLAEGANGTAGRERIEGLADARRTGEGLPVVEHAAGSPVLGWGRRTALAGGLPDRSGRLGGGSAWTGGV